MIEYLAGTLVEKTPTKAIILAGGVGYAALISLATYEALPAVGVHAELHVHLAVREDALTLFGFSAVTERELFLLLISVTGVGPKLAIAILSGTGIDLLKENIAHGNAAALTRLPGIGKKIAERVVLELRDKIGALDSAALASATGRHDVREEAMAALIALGYNRAGAEKALRGALKEGPQAEVNVETLIKAALKHIAG